MLSAAFDSISLEFNWNICKCHLYWYVDASDIIMNQNSIVWMFRKCFRFESWMSLGGFWKHSHLTCLHSDLFFKNFNELFLIWNGRISLLVAHIWSWDVETSCAGNDICQRRRTRNIQEEKKDVRISIGRSVWQEQVLFSDTHPWNPSQLSNETFDTFQSTKPISGYPLDVRLHHSINFKQTFSGQLVELKSVVPHHWPRVAGTQLIVVAWVVLK